ncbi:MAG: YgiT-type zinc finger protein [Deltaproteobacteria bacterium]|nr:YgiT-type zinc finger protein [Deltaproteobacteria bacterium]
MNALSKCVRCGSTDLAERTVERLVRGGQDVVVFRVTAVVCHHCGERYFSKAAIEAFEAARHKLERHDLDGFETVGQLLRPAAEAGA